MADLIEYRKVRKVYKSGGGEVIALEEFSLLGCVGAAHETSTGAAAGQEGDER